MNLIIPFVILVISLLITAYRASMFGVHIIKLEIGKNLRKLLYNLCEFATICFVSYLLYLLFK